MKEKIHYEKEIKFTPCNLFADRKTLHEALENLHNSTKQIKDNDAKLYVIIAINILHNTLANSYYVFERTEKNKLDNLPKTIKKGE
tara:strand:- start:170 stop:427 length:258 start_codon:yes stop_codon:yes gene_type:complete